MSIEIPERLLKKSARQLSQVARDVENEVDELTTTYSAGPTMTDVIERAEGLVPATGEKLATTLRAYAQALRDTDRSFSTVDRKVGNGLDPATGPD